MLKEEFFLWRKGESVRFKEEKASSEEAVEGLTSVLESSDTKTCKISLEGERGKGTGLIQVCV